MRKLSTGLSGLSSEKRRLLELQLRQKGISTLGIQTISQRKETNPCLLSFAQQRLWFMDQLEPGSPAYLIPGALEVDGQINVEVLERSFQELIDRHESLRTTFEERDGQPMQVIHPGGPSQIGR